MGCNCYQDAKQKEAIEQCMNREAFSRGLRTVKSWRCEPELRWRKPNENEIIALMEGVLGKHHPVLQQKWTCIETSEIQWRDVPLETPNAALKSGPQ
mgnify:CR=1 FL=1